MSSGVSFCFNFHSCYYQRVYFHILASLLGFLFCKLPVYILYTFIRILVFFFLICENSLYILDISFFLENGSPLQESHSPSVSVLLTPRSSPHMMSFHKDLSDSHFYGLCFSRPHLLREFQLFWSWGELGLGREGRVNCGGIPSYALCFVSSRLWGFAKSQNLGGQESTWGRRGLRNLLSETYPNQEQWHGLQWGAYWSPTWHRGASGAAGRNALVFSCRRW